MASINWDDPLLDKFNFQASDQTRVEAIIAAVDSAVDVYCKRNLAEATYDRMVSVLTNGDVHLKAYPVSRLVRVLYDRLEVLTVTTTAKIGVVSTGSGAIFLQALANGVLVPTTLTYADYPTLGQLVTAISAVSGFTASVDSDYADYPSTDLVPGVHLQNPNMKLPIFYGNNAGFSVDSESGILHLGFQPYDKIKVSWVGGYSTYPEDLKGVIADMVGQAFEGKIGMITGESFGGEYSYTLAPLATQSIPLTNKIILDSYKDRT